jgi:serine/threonine-protein kinase
MTSYLVPPIRLVHLRSERTTLNSFAGQTLSSRPLQTIQPLEATVDSVTPAEASLDCVGPECRVHLAQGSDSGQSEQTQNLLRSRLRSAALLMFAGFAAFLIWHTIRVQFESALKVAYYAAHFATTMTMGAISYLLASRLPLAPRQLRGVELATFGVPCAFFLLMQYERMVEWVSEYGTLPEVTPGWVLLIFTYALFIPNMWRRAAIVIGILAAAPLVATVVFAIRNPDSAGLIVADSRFLVETTLVISLAALSSVLGVSTINTLRDEAQRARQFGQYKLKRLIGAGGMGEVYLAEHMLMKRPCAIKVIRPEKAGDPKVLARFEREVQATAKLSHWNSVDIYDYGRTDDGTFYYVMEYLPGMNLSDLVKSDGPVPPSRAIHLIRQICNALSEAHEQNLVHRDIKPANIFAAIRGGRHDVAKLLDFGLAKPLLDVDSAKLTQKGAITGSPLFMSPEQATGDRDPDARSDIYALGAVLYFLVTGKPPFDDEQPMKVIIAHAHDPVVPPGQLNGDVPDDLEAVIVKCLQKPPANRFQTAAELAAALEDCRDYGRWTRENAKTWWQERERSLGRRTDEVAIG